VTDHRIDLTLYNLANVIEGDIDPLIEPLMTNDLEQKLEDLKGV
jgi:peptide chain release factor 1